MCLSRCALTAVSLFVAKGLERKPKTVREQWRECCYEAQTLQRGRVAPRAARGEWFCAVVGVGTELVEGTQRAFAVDADDVRATGCRVSGERGLLGVCDAGGVDRVTGHRETCVARGVAADAASGAGRSAAPLLCAGAGRSRVVCARVVSGDRALGLALSVTDQYGGNVPARQECPLLATARVSAGARHAVGGHGHGVSGPTSPLALPATRPVGGGLARSLVVAHRSGTQSREQYLFLAGTEVAKSRERQ